MNIGVDLTMIDGEARYQVRAPSWEQVLESKDLSAQAALAPVRGQLTDKRC